MSLLHRSASTESFRRASVVGSSPPPPPPLAGASTSPRRDSNGSSHNGSAAAAGHHRNHRDESDAAAQREPLVLRRLSYNPIPLKTVDEIAKDDVTPDEVSKGRRIAQVIAAVVYCLFAAGVVFGYAAIKPVLAAEGVYREQCTKREIEENVDVCKKQELRLNLMFTIAAVSTNLSALPVGALLDRYGPRVSGLVGSFFLVLGALLFAFASSIYPATAFDAYIVGYFCLAVGGPFVFISSFHLSNTFPERSGLILALLTGAFDTSSAVFLAYRLIYTGTNGGFKPRGFFLLYLVVPIFIALMQIFVMPANSYKSPVDLQPASPDQPSSPAAPVTAAGNGDSESSPLLKAAAADHPLQAHHPEALPSLPASKQIRHPIFIITTLFTLLQMLRINYFLSTIRSQYVFLLSPARAVELNSYFDVALPLGGILSIPFIGAVLDHLPSWLVLGLLVLVATLIGVLGLVRDLPSAYAGITLFVLYRPWYYTTISDFTAKTFGFATFGRVYGLIIFTAGLGNFLQSVLDLATHTTFDNDPRPVNIALLLVTAVVGGALSVYVWFRGRKWVAWERRELEVQAEATDPTMMPGADPALVRRERHQGLEDQVRREEREEGRAGY